MATTEQVKELRKRTGLSIMQCQNALDEANGDIEKAITILQKKSGEIASKKSTRTLGSGTIESYIHNNGTAGAIVELSCETDFVAKNEEFKKIAYEIAMQIVASDPEFLNADDVTDEVKKSAEEVFSKETEGKTEDIKKKIMEGKLSSYFEEKILMEQPYIKDPSLKIKDLVTGATQKFGERVEIRRFARFSTQN